jgi:hypothetical protein
MRKTHGFVVTLVAILVASGCDRGSTGAGTGVGVEMIPLRST